MQEFAQLEGEAFPTFGFRQKYKQLHWGYKLLTAIVIIVGVLMIAASLLLLPPVQFLGDLVVGTGLLETIAGYASIIAGGLLAIVASVLHYRQISNIRNPDHIVSLNATESDFVVLHSNEINADIELDSFGAPLPLSPEVDEMSNKTSAVTTTNASDAKKQERIAARAERRLIQKARSPIDLDNPNSSKMPLLVGEENSEKPVQTNQHLTNLFRRDVAPTYDAAVLTTPKRVAQPKNKPGTDNTSTVTSTSTTSIPSVTTTSATVVSNPSITTTPTTASTETTASTKPKKKKKEKNKKLLKEKESKSSSSGDQTKKPVVPVTSSTAAHTIAKTITPSKIGVTIPTASPTSSTTDSSSTSGERKLTIRERAAIVAKTGVGSSSDKPKTKSESKQNQKITGKIDKSKFANLLGSLTSSSSNPTPSATSINSDAPPIDNDNVPPPPPDGDGPPPAPDMDTTTTPTSFNWRSAALPKKKKPEEKSESDSSDRSKSTTTPAKPPHAGGVDIMGALKARQKKREETGTEFTDPLLKKDATKTEETASKPLFTLRKTTNSTSSASSSSSSSSSSSAQPSSVIGGTNVFKEMAKAAKEEPTPTSTNENSSNTQTGSSSTSTTTVITL